MMARILSILFNLNSRTVPGLLQKCVAELNKIGDNSDSTGIASVPCLAMTQHIWFLLIIYKDPMNEFL
jgi:hypothetical protein